MPVLFIGHGSPLNIVMENSYTRSLAALGRDLPRPRAVMVISAHWLTRGTAVTCTDRPQTIHDFYGFPRELYELTYPCAGAPGIAEELTRSVRIPAPWHPSAPAGGGSTSLVRCDGRWGLDHASWAVLRHMYPSADIPVFEMSLDYRFNEPHPLPLSHHYELARQLAPLRSQGVLIIGSGNIVHNLGVIDFENVDAEPYDWAVHLDRQVKECLLSRDHEILLDHRRMGNAAELGVPTLDHYLPMIYAIGLQEPEEKVTFVHEGMQNGSISMRSFRIG